MLSREKLNGLKLYLNHALLMWDHVYRIVPAGFDSTARHPVLMYVYGGPGSQTATDAWFLAELRTIGLLCGGTSAAATRTGQPVLEEFLNRFPATIELTILALILVVPVAAADTYASSNEGETPRTSKSLTGRWPSTVNAGGGSTSKGNRRA